MSQANPSKSSQDKNNSGLTDKMESVRSGGLQRKKTEKIVYVYIHRYIRMEADMRV